MHQTEATATKSIAENQAETWVAENAKAFEYWNEYVALNGLPLAKYRRF